MINSTLRLFWTRAEYLYTIVTMAYDKYGYDLVKGGFFDVRFFGRGRALKRLGWAGVS
jgi:hypothetical protein